MRLILSTVFVLIFSGNAFSQQVYQCSEIQRCENSYGGSKCTKNPNIFRTRKIGLFF